MPAPLLLDPHLAVAAAAAVAGRGALPGAGAAAAAVAAAPTGAVAPTAQAAAAARAAALTVPALAGIIAAPVPATVAAAVPPTVGTAVVPQNFLVSVPGALAPVTIINLVPRPTRQVLPTLPTGAPGVTRVPGPLFAPADLVPTATVAIRCG